MRQVAFILTLILMLTTCCNSGSQHERILADINHLTLTDADSARQMLLDMSDKMENAPEDVKAYYQLLTVKANDKALIRHTSDSLICHVAEYFEQHPQSGHLPEAYYYVGRANSDMQNGEKAILYYQKALLIDSTHVTRTLKIRIYAQMSNIYLRNGLYDEAIDMLQLARFYCQEIGDTTGARYCTEDIAAATELQKDTSIQATSKAGMMIRVQKLNTQIKNQLLNERNAQLEKENSQEHFFIWTISFVALLAIAAAIWYIRHLHKQRAFREEEATNVLFPPKNKRQFYDKEIKLLLDTHITNNKVLKDADWITIEERLLAAFPNFKERLFKSYNFSDTEYHICMLIKMEVPPSSIAKLMAIGVSTVSTNRLRMQQKVFDGEGTAKDWDKFILSL